MPFTSNGKNGGDYRQVSLNEDDDDNDPSRNIAGRQHQLLQEQDQGLEMLGQSAERLGKMSLQISEELGFQNQILTEMDTDLDEAYENLDVVTRKTKEFIKASGGTKNFLIILALIVVIVVLILLIVYV